MGLVFRVLAAIMALAVFHGTALAQTECSFAKEQFSVGATICECPSMEGTGGLATGGSAHISSRRLECSADGSWKPSGTNCLSITYDGTAGSAMGDFDKYNSLYCPRLPINVAEIDEAIKKETGKFMAEAPPAALLQAAEIICARIPKIGAECSAVLAAVAALAE